MATIRSPNELHFMQSFEIDPKKQKYETVRVPNENDHDISFLGWKNNSIKSKRFLVFLKQKTLDFIILQEKSIIFKESIFIDLKDTYKVYFELCSEGNYYYFFFVCIAWIYGNIS